MSGSMKMTFQNDIMASVAAFLELEATIKLVEVATMRNDLQEAERLRQKAHDLLDQHLDIKQSILAFAKSQR